MDKIKEYLRFLWIPLVAFALWLVYKIFVQDDDEEPVITPESSGLSASDITLMYRVVDNLSRGGNPYDISVASPLSIGISSLFSSSNSQLALELGQLLSKVQNKTQFARVFFNKYRCALVNRIADVYGERVFILIANNVTNFDEFYV